MNPSILSLNHLQKIDERAQITSDKSGSLTPYLPPLPPAKKSFFSPITLIPTKKQKTTPPTTQDFHRGIATVSSQIGYRLGLDSEALFQTKVQTIY